MILNHDFKSNDFKSFPTLFKVICFNVDEKQLGTTYSDIMILVSFLLYEISKKIATAKMAIFDYTTFI